MAVFNEWFPIAKESIAAYAEQQQTESQIAVVHPIESIYEIQREPSPSRATPDHIVSFMGTNEQLTISESICNLANGGANTEKSDKKCIKSINQKPQFMMPSEVQQKSILSKSSLMDVSHSKHVPNLHAKSSRLGSLTQQTEKILKEAKDKRKKIQTEIPISVINLKFS